MNSLRETVLSNSTLPHPIYIDGENLESRADEILQAISQAMNAYSTTGLNHFLSDLRADREPQLYAGPLGLAELICDAISKVPRLSSSVRDLEGNVVYPESTTAVTLPN